VAKQTCGPIVWATLPAEQKAELVLKAQADLDEEERKVRQHRRLSKGDGTAAAAAAAAVADKSGGRRPDIRFSVSPAKDGPLLPVPEKKKKKSVVSLMMPPVTPPVTLDAAALAQGGEVSQVRAAASSTPETNAVETHFNAHQYWAPSLDCGGFELPSLTAYS
jgi:hypothetical protein